MNPLRVKSLQLIFGGSFTNKKVRSEGAMEIKIVFSDIDGTFLTESKTVTAKTEQAVKNLLANDKKFVLVSARMPEAIYPITEKIGVKIPIISYSGGLVLTDDEKILHDKKIPCDATRNILLELKNYLDISINYYSGRKWFVEKIDSRVQNEMNITSATAELANFSELLDKNILPNKILIMTEPELCKRMERELSKKFTNLNVVRSHATLLEIMDKEVSKAAGIKILLNHYNFEIENALAFGDNYNDVEMLKFVGCGVAMGNAPADIKKIADAVTTSNEDDGIYNYLVQKNLIQ